MSHLERELEILNDDILELIDLVKNQLEKCKDAVMNYDLDLVEEIKYNEKRVDALELKIDRDCENILALYNPVAVDLRFVLATIKINSDLERIGDHANSMAKYIMEFGEPLKESHLKTMELAVMFDIAIEMINMVFEAYIAEDTKLARKVFSMDKKLNKIHKNSSNKVVEMQKSESFDIRAYLYLFSMISKMERVGDLTKNAAEEIVFYIEAKVLKHKKLKFKKKS